MTQTANPSLHELKRETEQTRAGLTQTVEQLRNSVTETASDIRHRLSPDAIKAEVADYVRSRGENLVSDITDAARRNPMQAVAVGASVAYPLFRLARAIPLPVLMVGAGLFFAGSKTGRSATQKASDIAAGLSEEARRRGRDLSEQLGDSLNAATELAADAADRARAALSTGSDHLRRSTETAAAGMTATTDLIRDKAASAGNTLGEQARNLKEGMAERVNSASSSMQEYASDTTQAIRDAAASAQDATRDAAKDLRDRAVNVADRTSRTVFETIEHNPLLVAGVGLLLGGLIASALPRSEMEDGVIGDASTAAKKRAAEAAAQGFESAKSAAGEIIGKVVRHAGAEGLTVDGLDTAARDLGERVRRVAETAVTTAFESDDTPKQNAGGGDQHG